MGRCILIKVPMELDQHYSCQWSCSINVHKKEDETIFAKSYKKIKCAKQNFIQYLKILLLPLRTASK